MADIFYFPFDSTPEDERLVLAEDWAAAFRVFFSDGIHPNYGSLLEVKAVPTDLKVSVGAGLADVQG